MVNWWQDVHLACNFIEETAAFFIKDAIPVCHHVALLARQLIGSFFGKINRMIFAALHADMIISVFQITLAHDE